MILTYSISLGMAWGLITYAVGKIATGKFKEISLGIYALAIVFGIYIFFGLWTQTSSSTLFFNNLMILTSAAIDSKNIGIKMFYRLFNEYNLGNIIEYSDNG